MGSFASTETMKWKDEINFPSQEKKWNAETLKRTKTALVVFQIKDIMAKVQKSSKQKNSIDLNDEGLEIEVLRLMRRSFSKELPHILCNQSEKLQFCRIGSI